MANMPDAPGGMTADRLRRLLDMLAHWQRYPSEAEIIKEIRAHADALEAREKAGMDAPSPDANEIAARTIREWQSDYATGDEVAISLLQESIAEAISAASKPRTADAPVEGMLSAEEYEAVLQKLSNDGKYGHSGFASDSVMCNCPVHRLWNHMRASERALRESEEALRTTGLELEQGWKRITALESALQFYAGKLRADGNGYEFNKEPSSYTGGIAREALAPQHPPAGGEEKGK